MSNYGDAHRVDSGLNAIGKRGHEWAVKKGFWEKFNGSFAYKIQRIRDHAIYAMQAFQEGEKDQVTVPSDKIDSSRFAEKLADGIIESASFLHAMGYDPEEVVKAKMDFNDKRADKQ